MIHAFLEWLLPIKVCLGLHKTVRSISSIDSLASDWFADKGFG